MNKIVYASIKVLIFIVFLIGVNQSEWYQACPETFDWDYDYGWPITLLPFIIVLFLMWVLFPLLNNDNDAKVRDMMEVQDE